MPLNIGKNNWQRTYKIFRILFVFLSLIILFLISQTSTAYASDRYWVGGTGNWSDTAHWSDSDGGGSGFSVPTSTDNVYFSAGSFSVNGSVVTLDTVASTASINFTGIDQTVTFSSSVNSINIYGSVTLPSTNLTWTFTGTAYTYLKATTSVSITMGTTINRGFNRLIFDGVGGTWTLQDEMSAAQIRINNGTLNTNNQTISSGELRRDGGNFTLNLTNSTYNAGNGFLLGSTGSGLTVIPGNSNIYINGDWIEGAGKHYNNIYYNRSPSSPMGGTAGNFSCENFYINPLGEKTTLNISTNITVNNYLTINGLNNTSGRIILHSSSIGTQRTITVDPAKVIASNVDFRDVKFQNPIDLSGIIGGSGDAGGNTGITFTTAQPQYFKHTSGAVNWSDSTKWFSDFSPRTTIGRVPLPQDDVYFDANSFTGTSTLTVNVPRIGRSLDMSGVDDTVTMTLANAIESYGSYILGDNVISGGVYAKTLLGVGNFNINTFNKNIISYLTILRGNYTALSDIILVGEAQNQLSILNNASFNLNGYNLSAILVNISSSGTLNLGSGTTTIISNNPAWSAYIYIASSTTLIASNSTIILNTNLNPTNDNPRIDAVNKTLGKVILAGNTTKAQLITQSCSISELVINAGKTLNITAGKIVNIGKLTANGTSLNPITIGSITGATHTLNFTGTGSAVGDYLNISYSTATPVNKWYASHSTNSGNNSGWVFANAPDAPTGLTPTAGNTQVSLSWVAPADNGTAIVDYIVDYKLTSDSTWSTFADGVSILTTSTIIGLTNGTSYDFRITAVNTIGPGNSSAVASAIPYSPSDRYWVGGSGNWSDTSHWSNVNGGTGGQSVPTSTNDVYFSAGSFSVDGSVVTIDALANTASLDFSGIDQTMTLINLTNTLNVYGSFVLSNKLSTSFGSGWGGGSLYFKATTTGKIITTNGSSAGWNRIYFDGVGGEWTNQDDWNSGTQVIFLDKGTWNTNDKNIKLSTSGDISYPATASNATLNLGSSTLTINSLRLGPNNVLNAGTSNIIVNKSTYNYLGYLIALGKPFVFNNITINFPSGYASVNNLDALDMQGSTINNLTYNGYSVAGSSLIMISDFTVLNNLSLLGSNSTNNRLIVRSNTLGTQRTITAANVVASNVDFRDIRGSGAANWDLSNITGLSGDAGGNTGITFTPAQPQYFKHTSGAVNWSDSTKWFSDSSPRITPGRVPLPQDDVYFDANSFTGTSTLTVNVPRIGRSLDMSQVDDAVTMTLTNNVESYGSHILGDNITPAGIYTKFLMGRDNFLLNLYDKSHYSINISAVGGTYTNMNNFSLLYGLIGAAGTFDFNDFDTSMRFIQPINLTLYLGNGVLSFTTVFAEPVFKANPSALYSEGSTIKLIPASGSLNITFTGFNNVFNKVWFSGAHTGSFNITGSNTISELIIDPGRNVSFTAGTTQQIEKFTAVGTVSDPIIITSATNATHTLNFTGTGSAVGEYLNISYSTATPANKWYASHSTNSGNNSGWVFANAPDAPTAVGAVGGDAQASISWSAPGFNGGTDITDYAIEYKLSSEPTIWSTFADGVSIATTGIVTGLVNGSAYDFRISAINLIGQGVASSTVTATPISVPEAPTDVLAIRGNSEVTVSFTPPLSDGGSPITSYTVTSNPGNQVATGISSPIVVTGLTNGTEYTFTVSATNVAGIGPSSVASLPVTPATIPDAPTTPIAAAGNAQVSLSWTAPGWNGGTIITDYVVEYKLSSEPTTWSIFSDGNSSNATSIVTGLINALSYDFRIYAVNDVGQGSQSTETSAMPITVPDAPTGVSGLPGNAEVVVSFTAPIFNGGSTINNYTVTSSPGNFTASGGASPLTITGLTNGTAYTFTVTATNAVGESLASVASLPVIPITVPDSPTAIIATEGNSQASIAFTPPVFDGGTPITSYSAISSPGGFTGTSSSSPIIITGLTNGTTYTFKVKAINIVGESPYSSNSNQVTLSTEPSAPVNLASTVLGSSIGLSWSTPTSNGGTNIIDYVVEYQLSTGGVWSVFADGSNTNTTAIITGLSNGSSYDFRVLAVNSVGQSIPSSVVSAIPGEPAQVIINNFSSLVLPNIGTNVRITNEGSADYEYQYTWCITDSATNLCGDADDIFSSTAAKLINHGENWDTTLNSPLLIPGNYYFHIIVFYGSESSNANQSFTALATYPDAPTSPTAVGGNASAIVSFTPSVFNGGSSITNYTVTSNPGGITANGLTSPITVNGLTNGIEYNFNVTATNIIGTSPASSNSNSVIPVTVPDAPTGVTALAGDKQVILSWFAPINYGGSAITDYVVEYKLSTEPNIWIIFADGISTVTSSTVTGLTNNLSYDFRISAVNAVGQSAINTTSATLAKNKKSTGSGFSLPTTQKLDNNEIPIEIPNVEIKPEAPIRGEAAPSKTIELPKKDTTQNKTDNTQVIVSGSDQPRNEITVTPVEKTTKGEKNNELGLTRKITMIIGGSLVGGALILLLVIKLLHHVRLIRNVNKSEIQPNKFSSYKINKNDND